MTLALEKEIIRPPEPDIGISAEIDNTWIQALGQVYDAVEKVVGSHRPKNLATRIALQRSGVYAARCKVNELGLMHGNRQVFIALSGSKIPAANRLITLPPSDDNFSAHHSLFSIVEDLNIPNRRSELGDDMSYIRFAVNGIGTAVNRLTPDASDGQRARLAIGLLNSNGIETNPIGRLTGEGSPLVLAGDIQMRIPLTPNEPHVESMAQEFGTFYAALDEAYLGE